MAAVSKDNICRLKSVQAFRLTVFTGFLPRELDIAIIIGIIVIPDP